MGELTTWSTGHWQTAASIAGAVTGVAALLVSALALWFAQARNRTAALVLTWHANGRLTLENRGPADARDVKLEVTHPSQRERQKTNPDDPEHMLYEVKKSLPRLLVGYSYEDRVMALLSADPDSVWASLSWRDDRLRRQSIDMVLHPARPKADGSTPLLSDRQIAMLADKLGAGIGAAVKDHLARRGPRGF
jgi:hypothetical protein